MTATQSFKIYEILFRYFKSENDAKVVVQEIETIIDNKFEKEKSGLASKEDIYQFAKSTKDDINRLENRILEMQAGFERRFNNMIMWTVSTGIAVVGILIAVFRLLPMK